MVPSHNEVMIDDPSGKKEAYRWKKEEEEDCKKHAQSKIMITKLKRMMMITTKG